MSKLYEGAKEKHPGRSRVKHILKGYKRGGAVHDDEAADRKLFKKMLAKEDKGEHAVSGHKGKARLDKRARGGGTEAKFARGGRTKKAGGTHINIAVVSPNKKPDDQQQGAPPMPPMAGAPPMPPPMPPPMGAPPPMQTGGAVSRYASGGGVEGFAGGGAMAQPPQTGGMGSYGGQTGGPSIPPPQHGGQIGGLGGQGFNGQTGGPSILPPQHGGQTGGVNILPPHLMPPSGIAQQNGLPQHPGGAMQQSQQMPQNIGAWLSQFGGAGKGGSPGGQLGSAGPARAFKRGGGVKFTGGAESGEGRLEKAQRQKRRG